MNFPQLRFKLFTRFLLVIILFYSCTKIITTDIGSGLLPPVDGVVTKDTVIEIATKNTSLDSVSVGISDDHVLGYINDPVFGETNASVNFQVAPESTPLSLDLPKDSIAFDSVVLCLKFNGAWGDTLQPLNLHVYSMDPEVVFSNSVAYDNTKRFIKGPELTEFNAAKIVDISTLDSADSTASPYKEPTAYQLRIRLNKSFGEKIIGLDSASSYTSDSAFYDYLRGLIVEAEPTGHALMRINLTDTTTHLSLYYHNIHGGDTITKRFLPNVLTSASSNTILRNYTGTQIPSYINNKDSSQDLLFMQTSPGGTKTFINISKVKGMPNVIVHRAEILMYQVPDPSDVNLAPPNLFLAAYNPDSARQFVIPYDISIDNGGSGITNLTQFGVSPRLKGDSYYYSFDISRYVQNIVTKSDTLYNLVLTAPYNQYVFINENVIYQVPISSPSLNVVGVGRIRLGGGNNSDPRYKMRLHIVYSLTQ